MSLIWGGEAAESKRSEHGLTMLHWFWALVVLLVLGSLELIAKDSTSFPWSNLGLLCLVQGVMIGVMLATGKYEPGDLTWPIVRQKLIELRG